MSRIGNKHITLPAGVTVENVEGKAKITGPKGTLFVEINNGIEMNVEGTVVSFKRANDTKQVKQNHGTVRANVNNAIVGVSEGYKKTLVIIGVGFKAEVKKDFVLLELGYSDDIDISGTPRLVSIVAERLNRLLERI